MGAKIKHVVVIMQENRSFDNLFYGYPGADTATYGYGHGTKYVLQPIALKWTWDITHLHVSFLEDYDDGKLDGFDNQIRGFNLSGNLCGKYQYFNHPKCWVIWDGAGVKKMAYSYVPQAQVQPYWTMAQRYALGDRTFSSNSGPSFGAHQFMIAGQADHVAELPTGSWGCDAAKNVITFQLHYGQSSPPVFSKRTGVDEPGPYPCFDYKTIADELDEAHLTWRYYVPYQADKEYYLSAFKAVRAIRYGTDWEYVRMPETRVLTDIAHGKLAQVTWIVPSQPNSDHAGAGASDGGPDWVASVVNAIGKSRFWKDTAIVVMWDEWGGWYDHVAPPQIPDPQTGAYEGLGFRVPVIVISPYAKRGYISHQQHEVASTLHLIENVFGLPSLGQADARTDGFDDMFDFTQAPRAFKPIEPVRAQRDAAYFIAHPSDAPGDY